MTTVARQPGRASLMRHTVGILFKDIGNVAAFLVSDGAHALTGNIEHIDVGLHLL